jgi:proteasome accessory factor B
VADSTLPVSVEERLFSLVLALLSSELGLTKHQILGTVQGYRQRYAVGGDNASLERQFERDKDDIRELGVPLETMEDPAEPGNNQESRYRIPKGDYNLPADITFTPEEITLLNLAGMVWREGSLSGDSRRALLKLHSLGVETREPVVGYAPRVRTRDAAFTPLTDALARRLQVRFAYLKPGETKARERTVDPLAVVQHRGRWYLFGTDQAVDAERTYLLSRIAGKVTITKKPSELSPLEPGEAGHAARCLAQLDAIWDTNIATVSIAAGSDADARLAKRGGSIRNADDTLSLHYTDTALIADELAGFGPEVLVLAPVDLIEAVRSRLERTAAAHATTSELPA